MPNFVPASARTMAVFELFAREQRELSNSEISRLLELPESTCTDLLHTLLELGYFARTAQTRRFYPTAKLGEVLERLEQNDPVLSAGTEAATLLAERTGETAFVGRLEVATVRVVAVQQGRHQLRYVLTAGERIALHTSAMGKALLGALPPDEALRRLRLKPLRKVVSGTVTDAEAVAHDVDEGRKRGWYAARSEGSEGVDALAVSGFLGPEPLSLSLAGPADRIARHHEDYLEALREVAVAMFSKRAA